MIEMSEIGTVSGLPITDFRFGPQSDELSFDLFAQRGYLGGVDSNLLQDLNTIIADCKLRGGLTYHFRVA